jgi:fused signal recognition particle receptor
MSEQTDEKKGGWFQRLKAGLSKSSQSISTGITQIFNKRKLDEAALEEFEELLLKADLGVEFAPEMVKAIARSRFNQEVAAEEVKLALAAEIAKLLAPWEKPFRIGAQKPFVVLVIGVNGSGKTTTIGKIAHKLKAEGKSVLLAAGDTFRAAIEQLQVWGQRVGAPVIARQVGADAAGLAFDAVEQARRDGHDVVMIDTAGRLQNKAHLMGELEKVIRVIKKADATAPHATLLVLDATTGQNALNQAEVFRDTCKVTGLIITKLDGTARGGVLLPLVEKYGIAVHYIGVGEKPEDLQRFDAEAYARAITGATT